MFVMSPVCILRPEGDLLWIITSVIAGLLLLLAAQIAFVGCYFTSVNMVERALSLICAVSLFVYIVMAHSYWVFATAIIVFAFLTATQVRKWLPSRAVTSEAATH